MLDGFVKWLFALLVVADVSDSKTDVHSQGTHATQLARGSLGLSFKMDICNESETSSTSEQSVQSHLTQSKPKDSVYVNNILPLLSSAILQFIMLGRPTESSSLNMSSNLSPGTV